MATSKQIKYQIAVAKKTSARLLKELNAAKARIKKLEGGLKTALAKEKAKPGAAKKPAKKKR